VEVAEAARREALMPPAKVEVAVEVAVYEGATGAVNTASLVVVALVATRLVVVAFIAFRLGAEDAPYFVREFVDEFEPIDLLQLPNHRIYLKPMIDGMPSKPFSAETLRPL
jgi:hypothetical protein